MVKSHPILNRRGMGVIALLVAVLILGLMWYFYTQSSKKGADNSNKSFVAGAGVDTSNYKGMLDSTKKVIKDAEASRSQVGY